MAGINPDSSLTFKPMSGQALLSQHMKCIWTTVFSTFPFLTRTFQVVSELTALSLNLLFYNLLFTNPPKLYFLNGMITVFHYKTTKTLHCPEVVGESMHKHMPSLCCVNQHQIHPLSLISYFIAS